MADYIERAKVLAVIQSKKSPERSPAQNEMLRTIRVDVNHIPAVDVAPQGRQEWVSRKEKAPDAGRLIAYASSYGGRMQYGVLRVPKNEGPDRYDYWTLLPEWPKED